MADIPNSGSYEDYSKLDFVKTRSNREFNDFFLDRRALNDPAHAGYNYAFFTAPELALSSSRFGNSGNTGMLMQTNGKFLKLPGYGDSIYTDEIVKMLSGDGGTFMKLFSNRAFSYPASSEVLDTLDYSETWNKYKISLGTSSKDSKISGNFEMRFREDQNLTITKCAKLWTNYIEALFLGNCISRYATYGTMGDTQNAIIDYLASMYMFTVRPDGKTLQYWAKYTGVFPNKLPYDIFQSEDGEPRIVSDVSIDFQFSYKEDMDIAILRDFNLLQDPGNLDKYTGQYYDSNSVSIGSPSGFPSIGKTKSQIDGRTLFELRMQDPNDPSGSNTNF